MNPQSWFRWLLNQQSSTHAEQQLDVFELESRLVLNGSFSFVAGATDVLNISIDADNINLDVDNPGGSDDLRFELSSGSWSGIETGPIDIQNGDELRIDNINNVDVINLTLNGANSNLTIDVLESLNLGNTEISFSGTTINFLADAGTVGIDSGNDSQSYSGIVVLDDNDTSFVGSTVTFNNALDATAADTDNQLTITGNAVFNGIVGGSQALEDLTVTGGTVSVGNSITITQELDFTTAVTITGNATLTGVDGGDGDSAGVEFGSTVNTGANNLTIPGGGLFSGAVTTGSGTLGGDNLEFDSTVALGGNVTTTGTQTYDGAVTLNDDAVVDAGTANITFNSTIDSESGELNSLTVNTTGTTTFDGVIGGTDRLSSLTTNAGGQTDIGANINLNGASATFNDAVLLTANVAIDEDGTGNVTFNSTVDSEAGSNFSLGVDTTTGSAVFNGAVGSDALGAASQDDGLGNITIDGPASLGANLTVAATNDIFLNGVTTLTSDVTLTARDVNVSGALDADLAGNNRNLVVIGDLNTNAGVNIGSSQALQTLSVSALLSANGNITTTGAQSYNNIVTDTNDVELSGSAIAITGGTTVNIFDNSPTRTLTLTADTLTLSGNFNSNGSAGDNLVLQPLTNTTSIGLGAAATGTFNLDATELALIQDGFNNLTIGRADGQHAIDFNGFNFSDAITIRTPNGGSIDIGGTGLSSVAGGATANILLDGPGATTTLNASISTAGASVTISDSVVVNGAIGIDTTNGSASAAGNIQIDGTITGANAGGTDTFSLNAAQGAIDGTGDADITLNGDVNGGAGANDLEELNLFGENISLAAVTVDGEIEASGNITLNGDITTTDTGLILFQAPAAITLAQDVTVTALDQITFDGTIDGAFNLVTVQQDPGSLTIFANTIGGTTPLASLTTNGVGGVVIDGVPASITTSGAQNYNLNVEFLTDATLTGSLINFGGTVENFAGLNNDLTIDGDLQTAGAIGTVDAFNSLTVTGTATVVADINTINDQSFGAVILNQNTTFTSTSGSISFGSIDSESGETNDLTIDAVNGTNTINGTIGATDAINNLTVNGAVQLGGAITTVGSQDYSAATSIIILDDAVLTSTGNSNFTFGTTIDSESGELNALTVNTTGTTTFNGVIGGTDRLSSLTTNAGGTTEIGANINTNGATVTFNDAVILTANTTIDEDGTGDITFNNTVNSSSGNNFSLATSTAAAGTTVFNGTVGGVDALTSVTVTGGTEFGADITTLNNQLYNTSTVNTLTADIVLTSINNTFISVNGTVDGTTAGQESLTIVTAGGIQLANGGNVGGNVRLESITANTAGSTTLVAATAQTTGTQSYNNLQVSGSTTLDGSAINIAGTANPIGANGSLTVIGDLTVVGAVGSVNNLTSLTTTGSSADFQSTITSSGDIDITADTLSLGGNVTTPGQIFLQPLNAGTSIGVADGATGTFNLTSTELDFLQDGSAGITIGRSDGTHVIDFQGYNFSDAIRFRAPNGGSININGTLETTAGAVDNTATVFIAGSGATTNLNADIITGGASVTISDSIVVNGARTIDTTNGDTSAAGAISIIGPGDVTGANPDGADTLTLDAAQGAVDGTNDANVSFTLGADVNGGDGAFDLEGLTITGDTITTQAITLDGNLNIEGVDNSVDEINAAGITIDGNTTLNGNVTSSAVGITFGDNTNIIGVSALSLAANVTVGQASGNDVVFETTVDGGFALVVNTTGNTEFQSRVGNSVNLASLTTDAGGSTIIDDLGTLTSVVATTGAQTYNDGVVLNQATELTASTVDFNSTVDSQATENNSLLVTGNLETSAAIGPTDALSTLTVTGNTSLGGNVTTTGQQTFGDTPGSDTTTLTADVTLQASEVQFDSTVNSDAGNNLVLAITGNLDANAEIGGTDALQSLSVSGTSIFVTDVTTVTTQNYTGEAEISSDVNFTGTTLTFDDGVDNFGLTNNNLTITGNLVSTTVGLSGNMGTLLVTGTSQLTGAEVNTNGGMTFQGDVTLTNASFNFTDFSSGNIAFDGNLTGTNTTVEILTIGGTIDLGNDAADAVTGIASFDIDAGNVSLANVTMNAGGTSDIDISGGGSLSQIAGTTFISPFLVLTGDGTFILNEDTNDFGTVAAQITTTGGTAGDASNGLGFRGDGSQPENKDFGYELSVFDANNITVGIVGGVVGISTTGTTSDVRVGAEGNLTVTQVVDTDPGNVGGTGNLYLEGAAIVGSGGTDLGDGDITLIGGSPDLIIGSDTTSSTDMSLLARRDVIIQANVSTTGGANIVIRGNDLGFGAGETAGDNEGGVLIDAGATVVSTGDLTITGDQLFNDPDGVGPLGINDPNSPGVVIHGATTVAGNMTVTTNTIDITANISSSTGTSDLILQPSDTTQDILLGGNTDDPTRFSLTTTELGFIQDGFNSITIGRADGQHNIVHDFHNYSDAIILNAPLGGTISIIGNMQTTAGAVDSTATVLIDGSGATTILGANIVTGGATVTISDSVLVNGTGILIDTTDGDAVAAANIQIDGTIGGANPNGNDTLSLDAAQGAIDGVGEADIILLSDVNGGDGAQDLEGLALEGDNIDLNTNTIALNVDGGVNILARTIDLHSVNAGSLLADGTVLTTLNANTNTTGFQLFNGQVILATDIVATSTASGAIAFNNTVNATTAGVESLTVNTASNTTFNGIIGGGAALASVTTDGPGDVIIGANVITTGEQNYNDNATLTANVTLTGADTDADGEGIEFGGTLDSDGTARNLTIVGGGQFNGAVGGGSALSVFNADSIDTESTFRATSVNVTGTSDLGGDVTTVTSQIYQGAVTLTANVIATSLFGGLIDFQSTIDSELGELNSLTVNTGGITQFSGAIGSTTALSSLTTDGPGQTNIDAGSISTNGASITFNDAVLLQSDTSITEAGTGNVTFNSTVDAADNTTAGTSDFGLTVNMTNGTPGTVFFNGLVGGDALGALSDVDGLEFLVVNGPVNLGANVLTTQQQDFNGTAIVNGAVTLTSSDAGNIDFASTIDGTTVGVDSLVLNTAAVTTLAGAIGVTTRLASITTDAAGRTEVGSGNINTQRAAAGDAVRFNDFVLLTNDLAIDAAGEGDITFGNVVDSANGNNFSLTTTTAGTGRTVFATNVGTNQVPGGLGDAGGLGFVTVNGPVSIGGNIVTVGEQNFNGNALLTGDAILTGTDTDADTQAIDFNGTVDGAFALTINGGGQFNGAVGSNVPLTSLDVNGTSVISGNVTTSGAQTFGGAAQLSTNVTFNGTTTTFNSTLDSTPGNNFSATFNSALITNAAVGGTDALSSLTTNTPASLGGDVTTVGAQLYLNSVTLTTDVVVTSTGGGNIGFNAVNGTTPGTESLTINTAGLTWFGNPGQNIGTVVPLESVTTDAAGTTSIFANVVTTTGTQTYNDPVQIISGATLNASTVTFAQTVDATDDPLVINGNLIAEGEIGGTGPLSLLTVSGTSSLHANVTTTGLQTYTGAVELTSDVIVESTSGGAITFGSTIQSADPNPAAPVEIFSLTVNTTGVTQFNGAIGGAPNSDTNLTSLTTDGISTGGGSFVAGGQTNLNVGTISTNGSTVTFNDAVLLQSDTTINEAGTGDVIFNSTVDAADNGNAGTSDFGLTVDMSNATPGDVVFNGVVGGNALVGQSDTDGLEFLSVNYSFPLIGGQILINTSGITTVGNQTYNGVVELQTNTSLAAALVDFIFSVDSETGENNSLTITGNLRTDSTFGGTNEIGTNNALGSLSVSGTSSLGSNVTTTGEQNYTGDVTLTANVVLTGNDGLDADTSDIEFAGNLDGGGFDLDIVDCGLFIGAVTNLNDFTAGGFTTESTFQANSITITGAGGCPTSLHGDVTTVGGQTYTGAFILSSDVVLTSTGGGDITFDSTVNSSAGNNFALTVNTSGDTLFCGDVGGNDQLSSLTTDAPGVTQLGANITTTGNQTYNDAVILKADVTFTASVVNFLNTVDSSTGNNFAATVISALVTNDVIGGADALSFINVIGTADLGGNINTVGFQSFNGPVVVTTDIVFTSLTTGTIEFNSTLDGTVAGSESVIVNTAGTTIFNFVGQTVPLESLTTDAPGVVGILEDVSTTGTQTFNDEAFIGSNVTLAASFVDFGSTVDSAFGPFDGNLTVVGGARFAGAVGLFAALGNTSFGFIDTESIFQATSIFVSGLGGNSELGGNVNTLSSQIFGGVIDLTGNVALTTFSGGNVVLLSNTNLTGNGFDLIIDAATALIDDNAQLDLGTGNLRVPSQLISINPGAMLVSTTGNFTFDSESLVLIDSATIMATAGGRIDIEAPQSVAIDSTNGPTVISTTDGDINITAGQTDPTGSIAMIDNNPGLGRTTIIQSDSGNISLTASFAVLFTTINADADAAGAAGIINIAAVDTTGNGGFIAENRAGEDPSTANLIGTSARLQATGSIGGEVDVTTLSDLIMLDPNTVPIGDIDLRLSQGTEFVIAAESEDSPIAINSFGNLEVGTVNGLSGVTIVDPMDVNNPAGITLASNEVILPGGIPSGSITLNADVVDNSGGDIFIAAEGQTPDSPMMSDGDRLEINGRVETTGGNGSIFLEAANDVIASPTARISKDGSGLVVLLAGDFQDIDGSGFVVGSQTGDVTFVAGSQLNADSGNILTFARRDITISQFTTTGAAEFTADTGFFSVASDGIGAIFDATPDTDIDMSMMQPIPEAPNVTANRASFFAATSIGTITPAALDTPTADNPSDIDLSVVSLSDASLSQPFGQISLQEADNLTIASAGFTQPSIRAIAGVIKLEAGGDIRSEGAFIDASQGTGFPINTRGRIDIDALGSLVFNDTVVVATRDDSLGKIELYGGTGVELTNSLIFTNATGTLSTDLAEVIGAPNNVEILVGQNAGDPSISNTDIITDFALTDVVRPSFGIPTTSEIVEIAPINGQRAFAVRFTAPIISTGTFNTLVTIDWDDFSDLDGFLPEGSPSDNVGAAPFPGQPTSLGVDISVASPSSPGQIAAAEAEIQTGTGGIGGTTGGTLTSQTQAVDINVPLDITFPVYQHVLSSDDNSLLNAATSVGTEVGDITNVFVPIPTFGDTFGKQDTTRNANTDPYQVTFVASLNNSIVIARDVDGDRDIQTDNSGNFVFRGEFANKVSTVGDVLLSVTRPITLFFTVPTVINTQIEVEQAEVEEIEVQEFEPFAETTVQLPSVTANNGAAAAGGTAGDENRFELRIISPNPEAEDQYLTEIDLPGNILEGDNRLKLFQGLNDNRYQLVFIKSDGTERVVIEVDVIQGEPITRFDNLEETINDVQLIEIDVDEIETEIENESGPDTTQVPALEEIDNTEDAPQLVPVSQRDIETQIFDTPIIPEPVLNHQPAVTSETAGQNQNKLEFVHERAENGFGAESAMAATLAGAAVLGKRNRRRARLNSENDAQSVVLDKRQRRRQRLFGELVTK